MKWIGLTGGIASGKSSASKRLQSLGVPVVDADSVAHSAFLKSSSVYSQVVQSFGRSILSEDGDILRSRLGEVVFSSDEKRKRLESLVHPFVRDQVQLQKKQLEAQGHAWAVYDVPLLFEQDMVDQFHWVTVVHCSLENQYLRLQARNTMSREQAGLRIQSQLPLALKKDKADFVLENNGSLEDLDQCVATFKLKMDELVQTTAKSEKGKNPKESL